MTKSSEPAVSQDSKLWSLLEAGITLGDELSIDGILQRIVETAASLTGARYAALGVIDQSGRELERFVTTGIEPAVREEIGAEPRGRGILGLLIRDPKPLRLRDIAEDPRSVGFPPGHPPMTSFLGVPVMIHGAPYGNLYLTDKAGGAEFSDEDEELVVTLARQAAVAVANTRLVKTARTWAHQLEVLGELTDSLLADTDADNLASQIVHQFQSVVEAEAAALGVFDEDGEYRVVAAVGKGAEYMLETSPPLPSRYRQALERGASVRVDSLLEDPDADPSIVRAMEIDATVLVPMLAEGKLVGVLGAADRIGDRRFTDADRRVAEVFAARATAILELSRRVTRQSVEAMLDAQEQERRRIGLELHDQTGQELTAALLSLKRVEASLESPDRALEELRFLRELIADSLRGVRRLSTMLSPPALGEHGLVSALEHLAHLLGSRSGIEIDVHSTVGEAVVPAPVARKLYSIAQEALTNVVRHAEATTATVRLERPERGRVALIVEDDGKGIAPDTPFGVGLAGIRERVNLLRGVLSIQPRPGGGTTLTVEVPLR
jgi:signal transduction histidine kinase